MGLNLDKLMELLQLCIAQSPDNVLQAHTGVAGDVDAAGDAVPVGATALINPETGQIYCLNKGDVEIATEPGSFEASDGSTVDYVAGSRLITLDNGETFCVPPKATDPFFGPGETLPLTQLDGVTPIPPITLPGGTVLNGGDAVPADFKGNITYNGGSEIYCNSKTSSDLPLKKKNGSDFDPSVDEIIAVGDFSDRPNRTVSLPLHINPQTGCPEVSLDLDDCLEGDGRGWNFGYGAQGKQSYLGPNGGLKIPLEPGVRFENFFSGVFDVDNVALNAIDQGFASRAEVACYTLKIENDDCVRWRCFGTARTFAQYFGEGGDIFRVRWVKGENDDFSGNGQPQFNFNFNCFTAGCPVEMQSNAITTTVFTDIDAGKSKTLEYCIEIERISQAISPTALMRLGASYFNIMCHRTRN